MYVSIARSSTQCSQVHCKQSELRQNHISPVTLARYLRFGFRTSNWILRTNTCIYCLSLSLMRAYTHANILKNTWIFKTMPHIKQSAVHGMVVVFCLLFSNIFSTSFPSQSLAPLHRQELYITLYDMEGYARNRNEYTCIQNTKRVKQ